MEALFLQIFVSFILVGSSILLFLKSVHQRDDEHADRLALLPIEDEKTIPHHGAEKDHVGPSDSR